MVELTTFPQVFVIQEMCDFFLKGPTPISHLPFSYSSPLGPSKWAFKNLLNSLSWIIGTSLVAQRVKHLPSTQETWVRSLGGEDSLEKEMATHSSILAWKTPWMEKPGELQSMDSQRVEHNWVTSLHMNNYLFHLLCVHLPLFVTLCCGLFLFISLQ